MSDEVSTVISLTENAIRLVSLGLYERYPLQENQGFSDWPPHVEAIYKRLNMARKILDDRGWTKMAERQLVDETSPQPIAQADKDDSVEVRLRKTEIEIILGGLNAFLDRANPTKDAFNEGKLVDPPEKVTKVIRIFETASKVCQNMTQFGVAEEELLR